jgi:hypothetical protein
MLLGLFLGFIALLYLTSWRVNRHRTRRAFARSTTHLEAVASQLLAVLLGVGLAMQLARHGPSPSVLREVHGPFGVIVATVLGSVSSGGPLIAYPLAGALFQYGAGLPAGVTAAFLTAWTSVSVGSLPLEAAALGRAFALTRNAIGFLLACAVGYAMSLFYS